MSKKLGLIGLVSLFIATFISTVVLGNNGLTFEQSVATLTSASILSLAVTGWIKVSLKLSGVVAWAISMITPIGLGFIAQISGYGIFAGLEWFQVVLTGLGVGLISNGMFSADTIKIILSMVNAQIKKKKGSIPAPGGGLPKEGL